jgi:D-glycero-alpha-D-manno-heptose 1-phosphate guanylyltransferase
MQQIDAIILAGGLGSRLRPAVPNLPKPMAPVNGKPFLDILMRKLGKSGIIRSVVLALSYRSNDIISWYEDQRSEFPFAICYSFEKEPLGTGGGVRLALDLVDGDTVLVMNGDSFVDIDYSKFLAFHHSKGADLTIAVRHEEDTSRYGSIDIDNNSLQIKGFSEKSGSATGGYINAGVYLFKNTVLKGLKPNIKLSLEHDLLPGCVGERCFGYITDGDFIDIGTPETYSIVNDFMRGKQ